MFASYLRSYVRENGGKTVLVGGENGQYFCAEGKLILLDNVISNRNNSSVFLVKTIVGKKRFLFGYKH